jgi:hypothetical protein
MGWVSGMAEVASSIHINSIVLFLFLIFILSSFILSYLNIPYLIFDISDFIC